MFQTRLLLLIISLFWVSPAIAQLIQTKSYEFNMGFYLGRPAYWGDYNGGLFGSETAYSTGSTPQKTFGTDISFGAVAWIPIKWGFSLRPSIEYGSLNYVINDNVFQPYFMKTPYRTMAVALQYDLDLGGFTPYLSSGIESLKFTVPVQNEMPEFQFDSPIQAYQRDQAISIPVTLGFNLDVGTFSSIFLESTMRFTETDLLDNYTPNDSKFSFKNDMIFSWQAGIRVQVINVIKLLFNPAKPQKLAQYTVPQVTVKWEPNLPELAQLPSKNPITEPIAEVETEATNTNASIPTPTVPAPIPVVDISTRVFDRDAELKKMEELQKQKEAEPVNTEPKPKSNLNWDPTIPIIQTKTSTVPDEIPENGFVEDSAPEGYYVQVFATVGPITSSRVRKQIIEEAKRQNLLADPEKQIMIMKRKQFYEVRIGVFDSYEQTLRVLEAMQGIYFDSYSLIYLPDNQ
ncbi:hypothetical protein EP331_10690 [bacterium]|nr:MAG: hypothetical protein EP331_10690 [bacterium]